MLVHNKGDYIRTAGEVTLVPGINDIDHRDFNDFSSHPIMKKIVDSGEIVALDKTTKDLSTPKAIELIEDTFSMPLLKEFKKNETRKTVLEVIDKKLREFE
ncbi:hypothetical protein [Virgibacillus kimchii]